MQLHDLPSDVLRLVLEASFTTRYDATDTLKANLPLLAVCRRWRYLVLAAVYSGVDICYGDSGRGSGSDDDHASSAPSEPDDAEITTNLDLVVSAGCVQTVKQMSITVYYRTNPFPGLDAVIRLMRGAAEEWRGVRQLDVSVLATGHLLGLRANAADHKAEIKQTSAALAATMPGVCRVFFDSNYLGSAVQEFGGRLAVLYSDQLESLLSRHPVIVPPDHTFGQLKRVSIEYGGVISYQHPRVDPARLVSLGLEWWPVDHSWAPFSADNGSKTIEFPSLKRLNVMYQPADVADDAEAGCRDGRPWELHFPELERLCVNCKQDTCSLLEYAVLPAHMSVISIKAAAPVLVRVAEMGLPASQSLKITVSADTDGNPAALVAANHILESAHESKELELEVEDRLLPVLPESIACTSLTVLAIWANTNTDTMLRLIQMLPRLARLHVQSLTLGNTQEDISVPGPDESRLVDPFNSSIEEMWIWASPDEPAPEMLVLVAKYLLLKIPTLVYLRSADISERQITEFVDAYSKRYPHLASIKHELGDY
ncbi:hypothetical protein H4R18_003704 [Coemansia javaensis]|uniref:Uncharacterized protein n=1 Tax=Coemansia javaensis TaxID=2761396 RepID=A0A9W8HCW4_9FUNG|nr:hypothetical protein H4R18_003704 [Coemansia javaensis]